MTVMSDDPKCHCDDHGYYHCSELRERLQDARKVVRLVLDADCLNEHAFDRGDDDASIYEACLHILSGEERRGADSPPSSSDKKSRMFAALKELYEDDKAFLTDLDEMVRIVTGRGLGDLAKGDEVRKESIW